MSKLCEYARVITVVGFVRNEVIYILGGIMKNPLLLTVREVSKLLRIRRQKVYLLIDLGCINAFKVGNDWRVRRESVEEIIGPIPTEFFQIAFGELAH